MIFGEVSWLFTFSCLFTLVLNSAMRKIFVILWPYRLDAYRAIALLFSLLSPRTIHLTCTDILSST